ncbi:hypothetical protein WISP_20099 [Willisornis vidua]|uniref:Uncharacterized protein n=1 Tax=Willisornis vidua TaxID=1566151 RepID=A0ABQ9DUZ8_9PASS|nr:hypothetical protein WISP_20099 [Willisornis vidua]
MTVLVPVPDSVAIPVALPIAIPAATPTPIFNSSPLSHSHPSSRLHLISFPIPFPGRGNSDSGEPRPMGRDAEPEGPSRSRSLSAPSRMSLPRSITPGRSPRDSPDEVTGRSRGLQEPGQPQGRQRPRWQSRLPVEGPRLDAFSSEFPPDLGQNSINI